MAEITNTSVSTTNATTVVADLVRTYYESNNPILGAVNAAGIPLARHIEPTQWVGKAAAIIQSFAGGLAVQDMPQGLSAVAGSGITLTEQTVALAEKIVSYNLDKWATGDAAFDLSTELQINLAEQVSQEMTYGLINAAVDGANQTVVDLTTETTTTMSLDALGAARRVVGDYANNKQYALIMHSAVFEDLMEDDAVQSAQKNGTNVAVYTGVANVLRGIPLIVTDLCSESSGVYTSVLVQWGKLGYLAKDSEFLSMDSVHIAGTKFTRVDWSFRWKALLEADYSSRSAVKILSTATE